jgi:hypothetical protein
MDFKLGLFKFYLEKKIAEQEQQTGIPIGTNTVEYKMLCNSDPGVISVFVGKTQPEDSSSSTVDIWYDFSVFREKTASGSKLIFLNAAITSSLSSSHITRL